MAISEAGALQPAIIKPDWAKVAEFTGIRMARLREDILYLIRTLEADLRIYEKQADLLFSTLNSLAAGGAAQHLDTCPVREELAFTALACRSSQILEDQMV